MLRHILKVRNRGGTYLNKLHFSEILFCVSEQNLFKVSIGCCRKQGRNLNKYFENVSQYIPIVTGISSINISRQEFKMRFFPTCKNSHSHGDRAAVSKLELLFAQITKLASRCEFCIVAYTHTFLPKMAVGNFWFVHLDNLPIDKMTQMIYQLKALI